ncbi:MAG: hypothetical protein O6943_13855 [Bacteroidetes bacterium]|nr:hypothetical protein [Bacteroidota bacterium]
MNTKNKTPSLLKQLSWLVIFSIAMAYLESAVVVYLREIYYPEGFSFPLVPINAEIFITEILRELATILMLAGIGILTGNSSSQRFAFFLLTFAIWDIFYYVFLYALLGWPSSLLTWDILFLVPIPWVGPVITPIIVSLTMIILASSLIHFKKNLNLNQWLLSILGSLMVIISWVFDYWIFISNQFSNGTWILSSEQELFGSSDQYIPGSFNWYIFLIGILLLLTATASHYLKNRKIQK